MSSPMDIDAAEAERRLAILKRRLELLESGNTRGRTMARTTGMRSRTNSVARRLSMGSRSMSRSRSASRAPPPKSRGGGMMGIMGAMRRRTTTRAKTGKKPKGAYRGQLMPRWAKGETKHILAGDGCDETIATQTNTALTGQATGITARDKHKEITIGNYAHFSLNPVAQGVGQYQRNGRSVDGRYLRIQGHIFNAAGQHGAISTDDNVGSGGYQKAYVRMLVLAVKGNTNTTGSGTGPDGTASTVRGKAPLNMDNLFKRIDGSITGFAAATNEAEAVKSVRSLQLPVNKSLYTVLSDQKFQLASTNESFGSNDRLFDLKIPLKQKTVWASAEADTYEKNQLVFVVMTVDPHCNNTVPSEKIHLEFESKYSYKDL